MSGVQPISYSAVKPVLGIAIGRTSVTPQGAAWQLHVGKLNWNSSKLHELMLHLHELVLHLWQVFRQ